MRCGLHWFFGIILAGLLTISGSLAVAGHREAVDENKYSNPQDRRTTEFVQEVKFGLLSVNIITKTGNTVISEETVSLKEYSNRRCESTHRTRDCNMYEFKLTFMVLSIIGEVLEIIIFYGSFGIEKIAKVFGKGILNVHYNFNLF